MLSDRACLNMTARRSNHEALAASDKSKGIEGGTVDDKFELQRKYGSLPRRRAGWYSRRIMTRLVSRMASEQSSSMMKTKR